MNALSKLFNVLHLSRRDTAQRSQHRRHRRSRRRDSFLSCETLEPKQLLAADVAVQFSNQVLDTTSPVTVAIEGKFDLTEVSGTVVQMATNAPVAEPNVYVALYDDVDQAPTDGRTTPLTVQNFLSYVNSSAYDNSMFHRSVSGFVLQGGGFNAPTVAADQPGSDPTSIVSGPVVQNEPGNSNVLGTIAMARLGADPNTGESNENSATNQFFFNMDDNEFLDSQNGGFTAFGEVLGSGMTTISAMNAALTYDATEYYFNTAMGELPLYNINTDNIIQPQDFLKLNTVDVVSESDLMTYEVTTSDSSKLTASFDSNGDWVLTPAGSATGSVDVTVTATSKLDGLSDSQTFSVTLNGGGPVAPVLTAIEELGSVSLQKNGDSNLYAGTTEVTFNGNAINFDLYQQAGMEAIAAESNINGNANAILWKLSNGSVYHWAFDSDWSRIGTFGLHAPGSSGFYEAATNFSVDLGVPQLTPVEQVGNIALNTDSSGLLYAGTSLIKLNGAGIRSDLYAAGGMTAVAAESNVDGSNVLVWKLGDGAVYQWRFDTSWERTEAFGRYTPDSSEFYTVEKTFGVDVNQDRFTGSAELIEQAGTNFLQKDLDGNLHVDGVPLTFNGGAVNFDIYAAAGMTAIAADVHPENGNSILWKLANGNIYHWSFDSSWSRSGAYGMYTPGNFDTSNAETIFSVDLTAGSLQVIEDQGASLLQTDAANNLYANGIRLTFNSAPINYVGFANNGMTAIGFETTSNGNVLLWKLSNGSIYQWEFDAQSERSRAFGLYLADSPEYLEVESDFEIDIASA